MNRKPQKSATKHINIKPDERLVITVIDGRRLGEHYGHYELKYEKGIRKMVLRKLQLKDVWR